jgi:hypothetical protein
MKGSQMTRKSSDTTSPEPEGVPVPPHRPITFDDIEGTETTLWLRTQLVRIREFMLAHDAAEDEEMMEAIDYAIEENERWCDPTVATDLGSGNA